MQNHPQNIANFGYPFGMLLPERTWTSDSASYRYGFNTQERVDEITAGHHTAEYWEYDSRLGRRWNVDPITYPWQSSYAVNNNCPIYFSDPMGLEGKKPATSSDQTYSTSGSSKPPSLMDDIINRRTQSTTPTSGGANSFVPVYKPKYIPKKKDETPSTTPTVTNKPTTPNNTPTAATKPTTTAGTTTPAYGPNPKPQTQSFMGPFAPTLGNTTSTMNNRLQMLGPTPNGSGGLITYGFSMNLAPLTNIEVGGVTEFNDFFDYRKHSYYESYNVPSIGIDISIGGNVKYFWSNTGQNLIKDDLCKQVDEYELSIYFIDIIYTRAIDGSFHGIGGGLSWSPFIIGASKSSPNTNIGARYTQ